MQLRPGTVWPRAGRVGSIPAFIKYLIFVLLLANWVLHFRWDSNTIQKLGQEQQDQRDTFYHRDPRRAKSEQLHELADDEANDRYWTNIAALERVTGNRISRRQRTTVRKKEESQGKLGRLDRIYYLNLPHRPLRRQMMEGWLGNQSVPFQRIEPVRGPSDPENCESHKRKPPARCFGLASLARTLVGIIRDRPVGEGLTLVLEDDYRVFMRLDELLRASLRIVPADWDIIRWDCTGGFHALADVRRVGNATLAKSVFKDECVKRREEGGDPGDCWFCGGTHVHLWRGSSVDKLARVWGRVPYNDVDCRLSTPELNSYCVNFDSKVGHFMHGELHGELSDVTSIHKNNK
jgi:hypothetical protein